MSIECHDLQATRERLVNLLLCMTCVVAAPMIIILLYYSAKLGLTPLWAVLLFMYMIFPVAALLRKRMRFGVRAFVVLSFFLMSSLSSGLSIGMIGDIDLFLFAMCVVATLLFGMRGGLVALLVSLVTFSSIWVLMQTGKITPNMDVVFYASSSVHWFVAACVIMTMAAMVVVSHDFVYRSLAGTINRLREEIIQREQAERRQKLMMAELDHRVKNNLANVMGLMNHTLTSSRTMEDFIHTFTTRIQAMARIHELLSDSKWEHVELGEMLRVLFKPYERESETGVHLIGPTVNLSSTSAQPLALALHELLLNAAKHGALADNTGRVEVRWKPEPDDQILISWIETGSMQNDTQPAPGNGLGLVRGLIEYELDGRFDIEFRQNGIACSLQVSRCGKTT